jgi:hypothetical protein
MDATYMLLNKGSKKERKQNIVSVFYFIYIKISHIFSHKFFYVLFIYS